MKKLYFLCLTILISSLSFAQTSDLFFSMYGEGSSNNKFLEIYNGTGSDVDLSAYSLSSCSNGCNTANEFDFPDTITFAPGTMLVDGDVYVIAHPSADATILAASDMTFNFLSNGDDAFALTLAGATTNTYTIIDLLGDLSDVDGSGWDVAGISNGTSNHTLTRKTSICDPNPSELGSFGTDAANSEWIVGDSNSGWGTLGAYTGCNTNPIITILSPSDFEVITSGTTSVDIVFSVDNAPGSATVDITVTLNGGSPVTTNNASSPFTITPTADGESYEVTAELIDGGVIDFETIDFSIAYPCDLQVGTITETCDAITSGTTDTYNVTIDYTGGGTSTYTIDTGGIGTVGGDDPSSVAAGTITITGVTENTDFVVTFTGDSANSGCDFTRNINSPDCDPELTLPLYDGFAYTDASTLTSAPNWDNISGSSDEILISTTSLNYTGLAPSTGNKATFDGGGIDNAIFFAPITSGTVYASFIFRVTDLSLVTDTDGGYFAFLGAFDGRLWVVPSPGGYQVGLGYNTGSADIINTTEHALNDEVFVVMSYETTTGVMKAWINPSSSDFEGSEPAETITFNDPTMAASIDRFALRQDNTVETGFMDVDELRLGTSWAEVTPTTLSTENFTTNNFKVYPNPTSTGFVNITSTNNDAIAVTVYDILGKQVLKNTLNNNQLNVSSLNTGVYILKISQNNASVTKKLVIE
ncbi:hypothetical protein A9Q86_14760 [Flavobacteriales bacterium 33_180_T64]|nr:hypothetical protein A9Q86_14760 [Flavobacteriales bacterium 33_180_T64]